MAKPSPGAPSPPSTSRSTVAASRTKNSRAWQTSSSATAPSHPSAPTPPNSSPSLTATRRSAAVAAPLSSPPASAPPKSPTTSPTPNSSPPPNPCSPTCTATEPNACHSERSEESPHFRCAQRTIAALLPQQLERMRPLVPQESRDAPQHAQRLNRPCRLHAAHVRGLPAQLIQQPGHGLLRARIVPADKHRRPARLVARVHHARGAN